MESHKTYQAINPVELAKISQELIVKKLKFLNVGRNT